MKSSVFATFLLVVTFNALADEPYKHEYENGGYFEAQQETTAPMQQSEPYKHQYLNGDDFDFEAQPDDTAEIATPTSVSALPLN